MIRVKSQSVQYAVEVVTFICIIGALSMIWPAIIAVFLGVLLLLQSFSAEPEIAVLSCTEIGNLPIAFASFRRAGPPSILS